MKVWTLTVWTGECGTGLVGIFSSYEKAEQAAEKETKRISEANTSLSQTWYRDGNFYFNGPFEVILTEWEVA